MAKQPLNQALFEKTAALYQETGSLQRTADALGVAYAKVRKILITMGAYDTPLTRSIGIMRQAGQEPTDIAESLGMSVKRVNAFLPYEKGIYREETPSTDAKRSRLYRKRMDVAGSRLISKTKGKQGVEAAQEVRNNTSSAASPRVNSHKNESTVAIHPVHLHLELTHPWLDDDQKHVLWQYADATREGSLTRDILIPSDMPLHHLHYAIQRLYGWQNSHLRAFRLDEADDQRLTEGMFNSWVLLAGILYKGFDDWDEFWGDDYQRGSFRNWLKSKYTGPYRFSGVCEDYHVIQQTIGEVCRETPEVKVMVDVASDLEHPVFRLSEEPPSQPSWKTVPIWDVTIAELEQTMVFDNRFGELLEKLEVASVLAGKDTPLADSMALIEHFHAKEKRRLDGTDAEANVLRAVPVTRKLLYNYDFGDNWMVEITRGELEDTCKATGVAESAFHKACRIVVSEHRPVCIAKRGAQLMDDVGGLHGYAEFMDVVNRRGPDQERAEHLEWAKGLGWNGRDISLEAML